MKYKVYAALHDETNEGWVWLKLGSEFIPRMTICLVNRETSRKVYCEYRKFDLRFVRHYNESAKCYPLPEAEDQWGEIATISDWYRSALGGLQLQHDADVEVKKPAWAHWADLRAACQHPEPGARVSTRLAVFGTWLATSAFFFALQATYQFPVCVAWVGTAAFFIVALAARLGRKTHKS